MMTWYSWSRPLALVILLLGMGGGDTLMSASGQVNSPEDPPIQPQRTLTPRPGRVPRLNSQSGDPHPQGEAKRPSWIQDLNLTKSQLKQIRQIRLNNQRLLADSQLELQTARQKLVELLIGSGPQEQVRAQYNTVQTLAQKVENLRMETLLGIREVLSPEQRRHMNQLIREHLQNRPPIARPIPQDAPVLPTP